MSIENGYIAKIAELEAEKEGNLESLRLSGRLNEGLEEKVKELESLLKAARELIKRIPLYNVSIILLEKTHDWLKQIGRAGVK